MNELAQIPFGLRQIDNKYVDVSDVSRGIKCNCICPSCKTPLIARQGEVNEWHFAHVSKGVANATKNECEYSFWLSVTLMAKQIIALANSITLPSLIMYTNSREKVKVTDKIEFKVSDVEIEKNIDSIRADAILHAGKYVIAVVFRSPHRHVMIDCSDIKGGDKFGVLEISLSQANQWLFGQENHGKYSHVLRQNILSGVSCKRWLHHPRKLAIEKQRNISLNRYCPKESEIHASVERKHYKCIMCHSSWFGLHKCECCGTHIYTTEINNT